MYVDQKIIYFKNILKIFTNKYLKLYICGDENHILIFIISILTQNAHLNLKVTPGVIKFDFSNWCSIIYFKVARTRFSLNWKMLHLNLMYLIALCLFWVEWEEDKNRKLARILPRIKEDTVRRMSISKSAPNQDSKYPNEPRCLQHH